MMQQGLFLFKMKNGHYKYDPSFIQTLLSAP